MSDKYYEYLICLYIENFGHGQMTLVCLPSEFPEKLIELRNELYQKWRHTVEIITVQRGSPKNVRNGR